MNTDEKLRAQIRALRTQNIALNKTNSIFRDKTHQLMRLSDTLYEQLAEPIKIEANRTSTKFDGITLVIAAYNIPQQIQRTLISCTPYYQNIPANELEIIIIDNGSRVPLSKTDFKHFPSVSQVIRVEGQPSPVHGLNKGIEAAKFSNVGVMIDGAHMLSPGVLSNASSVLKMFERPVIDVPQYILGTVSQNLRPSDNGFEREATDLKDLGWPEIGYSLFDYAVMPGEQIAKNPINAIESNCLISSKGVFKDCGAYDERFDEAGAGLANIEIFSRLTNNPNNKFVSLAGEGTFHQDHHGTTTSVSSTERDALVQQYYKKFEEITGNKTNSMFRGPFVFGDVSTSSPTPPTISRDYGVARNKILQELASIYEDRARYDQKGPMPSLTLKATSADERKTRPTLKPLGLLNNKKGQENLASYGYRSILQKAHDILKPRRYFEIGVDDGASISMAKCPAVGVDPDCEITSSFHYPTQIFRKESDSFFGEQDLCERVMSNDIDLAFIDGMHLAEFVLRDFINVEKWVAEGCVVIIDDVYPEQFAMAERDRKFNAWCGDVFKIIPILLEYRPDLEVDTFEAFAGPYRKGVATVSGLDSSNTVLSQNRDQIIKDILGGKYNLTDMNDLARMVPITPINKVESVLTAAKNRRN